VKIVSQCAVLGSGSGDEAFHHAKERPACERFFKSGDSKGGCKAQKSVTEGARDRENRKLRINPLNFGEELEPVHVRHLEVGDEEIKLQAGPFHTSQSLLPCPRFLAGDPACSNHDQRASQLFVIVGDQDSLSQGSILDSCA
jgi:hypothetical protein